MENLNTNLVEETMDIINEVEVLDTLDINTRVNDPRNTAVVALAIGAIAVGIVGVSKFVKSRKAKKQAENRQVEVTDEVKEMNTVNEEETAE